MWKVYERLSKDSMAHFHWLDKDDFFGFGILALCAAAKSYNPGAGYRFSTYAFWCIHNQFKSVIDYASKILSVESLATPPEDMSYHYFWDSFESENSHYELEDAESRVLFDRVVERLQLNENQLAFVNEVILGDDKLSDFAKKRGKKYHYAQYVKESIRKKARRLQKEEGDFFEVRKQ